MEGLDCANLLALIQIATVFDFGLYYLRKKNSLTYLHKRHKKDLRCHAKNTIENAAQVVEEAETSTNNDCRLSGARLERYLNKLKYITDSSKRWNRYTRIGLYAGVYGMFCMFFVGIFGCKHEPFAQRYLLIIAECFILAEMLIWMRVCMEEDDNILYASTHRDISVLLMIIFVGAVFAYFDWTVTLFSEFEAPFVASLIVVYFPIIAFILNALYDRIWVHVWMKKCNEGITITQRLLNMKPDR